MLLAASSFSLLVTANELILSIKNECKNALNYFILFKPKLGKTKEAILTAM